MTSAALARGDGTCVTGSGTAAPIFQRMCVINKLIYVRYYTVCSIVTEKCYAVTNRGLKLEMCCNLT